MTASSSSSFFTKEKLFQTGQVDRKYVSVSSFLLRSFGFKLSLFFGVTGKTVWKVSEALI